MPFTLMLRFIGLMIALILLAVMISSSLAAIVFCARNIKEGEEEDNEKEEEDKDKKSPTDQTPPPDPLFQCSVVSDL